MKKILITGASGFVGGYLAEYLVSFPEYKIYGTYLSEASYQSSPVKDAIEFLKIDLQNKEAVRSLIAQVKPDEIYHLAAQANVAISFQDPIGTLHANVDPAIHIFESLRQENLLQTKVLVVSSAEVYGYIAPDDLPVSEMNLVNPVTPYAISKVTQDLFALQYYRAYAMPLVRVRAFNHIGPRQHIGFVVSDFAKQIAAIEKGTSEPIIHVGNLEAKRDFTDVRDMVIAYRLILEKGQAGEVYNIGSGAAYKIQAILDRLLALSTVNIAVMVDKTKLRPSDIPEIVCDSTKCKSITGWQPTIPLEETLKDILDYWRNIE